MPLSGNIPQIEIVEASAGSGKTYALAQKYLDLLTSPKQQASDIPFKNILAITFTNAAALEMKSRILAFLKERALKGDRQAEKLLESIFRNYNFFAVRTIDSFIKSLLAGCAFPLGLTSGFEIRDDSSDYLAYSFDALIDRAAEESGTKKLFTDFLDHYLIVAKKNSWSPKKDLCEAAQDLFNKSNTFGRGFARRALAGKTFTERKAELEKLVAKLGEMLPAGTHSRFADAVAKIAQKNDLPPLGSLSTYFTYEEIPIKKGSEKCSAGAEKLWETIKQKLKELAEIESLTFFNPYVDIFAAIMKSFQEIARRDEAVFLAQLNTLANRLFAEELITVPELYLRIATTLHHYLLDEFQDTSPLQWDNLFPLIKEALDSGGSLFYVGDKKQAIYRFRGGDPTLFNRVKTDYFPKQTKTTTILENNYRSEKAIVEWNNEVFSPANLARFISTLDKGDFPEALANFANSTQKPLPDKAAGYVKVTPIDGIDKDERELKSKENLLAAIKELSGRFDYGQIAILARENDNVELATEWLLEAGIPVASDKTLSVRANPAVKELVSFLKFLISPIDDLSFASFILGEIFQKAAGLKRTEIESFLLEQKKTDYYYRAFREKFPQVWTDLINPFFQSVGFIPFYEFIISLLKTFNVPANFPQRQAFLMKFIELVKEKEKDAVSLEAFIEYFEEAAETELYVFATEVNAVKVETIHRAKGLDFGVVILPFLGIEVSPNPELIAQNDDKLSVIKLNKDVARFSAELDNIYLEEYQRTLIDELNNIYVALTRAKHELYIFLPNKIGNSKNLAGDLIPETLYERGNQVKYKAKDAGQEKHLSISPSSYTDWLPLLKNEFLEEYSVKHRELIVKGDIFHKIFSLIGNTAGTEPGAALDQAIEQAKYFYPGVDLAEYRAAVLKILNNKKLKRFFFIENGSVYQEKEIVLTSGETERLDRLIVTPNEILIVDYKSSRDFAEAHQQQVGNYIAAVKNIFPERPVKGFLLYLDSATAEEVLCPE
ncbi:MAG: UvrD-helicase domain-containing protein [Candidatus Margulisbacteria bacterium]|nr:UvrD-helicase domain-containing protein [Candidatus Margulisiibacteriota bacterium]